MKHAAPEMAALASPGAATGSSSGRARAVPVAADRVARYLGAAAPIDDERLSHHVTALLEELPEGVDPATAVAYAQERLERWWHLAFEGAELGDVHARRALARLPDALLSIRLPALRALRRLRRHFAEPAVLPSQPLAASRMGALIRLTPLVVAGTAAAWLFYRAIHAAPALALPWAALFGLLLALHLNSAVLAILGLVKRPAPPPQPSSAPLPPTAIVMPVYEEDPQSVFAALCAMRDELLLNGRAEQFAFYVLSDTQSSLRAADEERAWRRLAALTRGRIPVYYRRRSANLGKKAGNLAEFAVRNVHRFTYAVILDADSLMGAHTLVSLVERMEREPQLGLLQAPIALRGGKTLFARALQFSHALAGPLLFRGLGAWSGPDGNYYGHNAVVRLRAFVDCCGLPTLQGSPPLGGPILSHDFVEAALLRRAGWEVRFATELEESFEEPPPTLSDYLTRDRRWCQGNLQHLRVVAAEGLTSVSRLHLLFGAFAYLMSPLWLMFLAGGALAWATGARVSSATAVPFIAVSMGALLLPRLLGWIHALIRRSRDFGGPHRVLVGGVLELILSTLLAPVLLLAQTGFVLEILLGGAVDWRAQRRRVRSASDAIDRRLSFCSIIGVAAGAGLFALAPPLAWMLAPVWVPWALAQPLAMVLARRSRSRFLSTAVELHPAPIVSAAVRLVDYFHADQTARFRDIVLDPVLNTRRRLELDAIGTRSDPSLEGIADKAIARGPAALRPEERDRLLADPDQLKRLHARAWREWPVEAWSLPRQVHAEPPMLGAGEVALLGDEEEDLVG